MSDTPDPDDYRRWVHQDKREAGGFLLVALISIVTPIVLAWLEAH